MELSCSRTYPVGVADAFDLVLPMSLPTLFRRWFGPIPPIRRTEGASPWGAPGQQRKVVLAGPGQMQETLTEVDPPHAFGYVLSGVTGPLAMITSDVDGRWQFALAGTGTRITWSWDVSLTPVGRVIAPLFAWCWHGYARRALAELERQLVPE